MDRIKKNLIKEIDELIIEGYKSYYDLSPCDRSTLVAYYMDTMGQDALECVFEAKGIDATVHKLRQFIFSGSTEKAYDLADTMRENAEKYLSTSLQKLYDEQVPIIEAELNREAGLKPYQHKDNGETEWIRV